MSRKDHKNIKARVVPLKQASQNFSAELSTRPLKLAFIINERASRKSFLEIVKFNSIIWGGYFNVLIPTDGHKITDDWWKVLLRQNPDKVVFCGKVAESLASEIYDRVQPFCMWIWSEELLGKQVVEGNAFDCIPMLYLLLQDSRHSTKLNLGVLKSPSRSIYRECLLSTCGLLPESYQKLYFQSLQAEWINPGADCLSSYLDFIADNPHLTPIETTALDLSPMTQNGPTGFTIVITSGYCVSDLCLFWSLRMRPSLGRLWTVLIPRSSLLSKEDIRTLAGWLNRTVIGTDHIVLASTSVSKRTLLSLKAKLAPELESKIENIDICFGDFEINNLRARNTNAKEKISVEDGYFSLGMPKTTLADEIRFGEWVVDVQIGRTGYRSAGAFRPPNFNGLNSLVAGNPSDLSVRSYGLMVRSNTDRVSYRVRQSQETLNGVIPTDDEVFLALLNSKGYGAITTDKSRYTRRLIELVGGLAKLKIWQNTGFRELFQRMSDGKQSYTVTEMVSLVGSTASSVDTVYETVAELALRKVFLRGYKLQCPACDLTQWYEMAAVNESMACAGCLTSLQPPVDALFRYRLNDLVARGIMQGTMSVGLTLLFLRSISHTSFMFVPGVEINKRRKVDIDIIGSCDGQLFVAECKDLRQGATRATTKSVIEQLTTLVDIAVDVGAKMVFLSILRPEAQPALLRKVALFNKDNFVSVHLLTAEDLEKGQRDKFIYPPVLPGESVTEHSATQVRCTLYDFLPRRRTKQRRWVRTSGIRSVSF